MSRVNRWNGMKLKYSRPFANQRTIDRHSEQRNPPAKPLKDSSDVARLARTSGRANSKRGPVNTKWLAEDSAAIRDTNPPRNVHSRSTSFQPPASRHRELNFCVSCEAVK